MNSFQYTKRYHASLHSSGGAFILHMHLTLLGVSYRLAHRRTGCFLRKDAQISLFGESENLQPKRKRRQGDRRKRRNEAPGQGSLFDTGELISMDSLTPSSKGKKGPTKQGEACKEEKGWYGQKGKCVRKQRSPDASGESKKVSKANQVSMAKQELVSAQKDLDLAGKLYGNKNAVLSPEEFKRSRQLGLDRGGVNYATLDKFKQAEKKARERLESLSGKKKASQAPKKIAKGPMTLASVNAPFTPEESKKLASTFEPATTGDAARISLASARETAIATLREVKQQPGYGNVTVGDAMAIQSYTSSGYIAINGALRGMQVDPSSDLAERQRLVARATQQAIQKLPKYEGIIRRDTRLPAESVKQDFQVGKVISFDGLTSASTDLSGDAAGSYGSQSAYSKASSYGDNAKKNGIQAIDNANAEQVEFRIQSKTGRDISPFSTRKFEREILLPHKWKGRVSKVETVSGKTVIHMEEV